MEIGLRDFEPLAELVPRTAAGLVQVGLIHDAAVVGQDVARGLDLGQALDLLVGRATELDAIIEVAEPGGTLATSPSSGIVERQLNPVRVMYRLNSITAIGGFPSMEIVIELTQYGMPARSSRLQTSLDLAQAAGR